MTVESLIPSINERYNFWNISKGNEESNFSISEIYFFAFSISLYNSEFISRKVRRVKSK
jgi:hypothetical protein